MTELVQGAYPPLPEAITNGSGVLWNAVVRWSTCESRVSATRATAHLELVVANLMRDYVDADRAARAIDAHGITKEQT